MTGIPKPVKGTALAAKRRRKAQQTRREQQIMTQAKVRDGYRCRACGKPGSDAAHLHHRGMGGNPAGDRTTLDNLVCLCRECHRKFDSKQTYAVMTDLAGDGPVRFVPFKS